TPCAAVMKSPCAVMKNPVPTKRGAEALTRRVRTHAHHRRYGSLHHLDRGKKRITDGGRLGRRSAGRNGNSYRYHGDHLAVSDKCHHGPSNFFARLHAFESWNMLLCGLGAVEPGVISPT